MKDECQELEQFHDILNDFSTAMLTTRDDDGLLVSRPMQVAKVAEDSEIYFVTSLTSGKIDQIKRHPKVCVSMQGSSKYLSLSGVCEILNDRSQLAELWNPAWDLWFPEGISDSSVVLLNVLPKQGEFWDVSGTNRLKFIFEAGRALIQGEGINAEKAGENAKISFK